MLVLLLDEKGLGTLNPKTLKSKGLGFSIACRVEGLRGLGLKSLGFRGLRLFRIKGLRAEGLTVNG